MGEVLAAGPLLLLVFCWTLHSAGFKASHIWLHAELVEWRHPSQWCSKIFNRADCWLCLPSGHSQRAQLAVFQLQIDVLIMYRTHGTVACLQTKLVEVVMEIARAAKARGAQGLTAFVLPGLRSALLCDVI